LLDRAAVKTAEFYSFVNVACNARTEATKKSTVLACWRNA